MNEHKVSLTGNDLVVVASNPQEMVDSQHAIIASVSGKIEQAKADVAEAKDILRAADMAKIDDSAAKRLLKREEHRLMYLEKTKAALEAGYVMLPNIPGQLLAIRVQRGCPEQKSVYSSKSWPSAASENPDALPAGEGRYVKPVPESTILENRDVAGNVASRSLHIGSFDEHLALPVEFLKPTIIERTGRAFDLKIFDEMLLIHNGASGDSRGTQHVRQGDPLVIGRIIDAGNGRRPEKRRRVLSFLVAWFVDTAAI